MSPLNIVFIVLQLLSCIFLISVIILQSGKRSGLSGAISGAAETFFDKNRARTIDAFLARWTKFIAIAFFVLVLVAMVVSQFIKADNADMASPTDVAAGELNLNDLDLGDLELDFGE